MYIGKHTEGFVGWINLTHNVLLGVFADRILRYLPVTMITIIEFLLL